jgi:hypothetical protein
VQKQEQLDWEARVGRFVAAGAFASALLLFAWLVYANNIVDTAPSDTVEGLRLVRDHESQVLVATFLQAIATALLAVPLWFLFKAAKARRPETPSAAKWLTLIAPPLMAVITIARQFVQIDVAKQVSAHLIANPMFPKAANDYAKEQLSSGAAPVLEALVLAATLGIAFAFVLISLNAMRAGLLSKFMGILGIIVGALFVLPILGQVPFVQLFWVAAIGLLALGRWPQGGRGPAWETGEADPWPTARDRAEEMAAARAAREEEFSEEPARPRTAVGALRQRGGGASLADDADGNGNGAQPERRASPQHPRSKKRKRKRR